MNLFLVLPRRARWHDRLLRCLAVSMLLGAAAAWAQGARTGTVRGTVSNKATGDLLIGASITVDGTPLATTTERGGEFTLVNVPAGSQTLVVSYAGLDASRVPVTVEAGATATVQVPLTSSVYVLEPVSVMGIREGNALAIQQQRQAMNVKTVVATDVFGNPAANPGELIQRLPGIAVDIVGSEVRTVSVRGLAAGFAQLTVDGDRQASSQGTSLGRDVQIEQLGTANVGQVELIKAPTPDMDANAIGGYMNLVTRRSFDSPRRVLNLTTGVLWRDRGFKGSPFQDRADGIDLFGLTFSDAFGVLGKKRNLGVYFNINYRKSATTQDEMGPGALTSVPNAWLNPLGAQPLQRVFGTGDIGYKADSRNSSLALDFKASDTTVLFTKFQVNTNYQFQQYFRPTVGWTGAGAAAFSPDSTFMRTTLLPSQSVTADVESSNFNKKSLNWHLSGGVEQKMFAGAGMLTVRGNYSHANINYPAWIRLHNIARGIGYTIDRNVSDQWYPNFTQNAGPDLRNPASYTISNYTRQAYKAPNDIYGGRVDYKHTFSAPVPVWMKIGAKIDNDERSQAQEYSQRTWLGADGVPNSADDAMTPYTHVQYSQAEGRYGPFPYTDIPGIGGSHDPLNVPANYWGRTALDAYNDFSTSLANDLKIKERIKAAYIMGNLQLGKLRVMGGLRVEETETEATGWVRNTTATYGGSAPTGAQASSLAPADVQTALARAQRSFVRRETADGKYKNVFPGVHFVYEPWDGLIIRTSYNKSITRPPSANLIPTITDNSESQLLTVGNPGLRPYTADNFELGVEKYFEPIGVVSVNLFRKNLNDYFRNFDTPLGPGGLDGNGQYANYTLRRNQNIGQARIQGIEFRYDQQFSFLPGFLRGFGLNSNFTVLETEGDFGGLTTTKRLAGFRPRSGNAGLSFRGFGLQANLVANWSDRYFFNEPATGVRIYNAEKLFVDLKLQYTFSRRYDAFFEVYNLFDAPAREEQSEDGRLYTFKTNQGVGFVAGVRARF